MDDINVHAALNCTDELLYNDGGCFTTSTTNTTTTTSTTTSSSAIFGKSLKKYSPIQLKNETHNMITSFNFELFSMTCNKDSPSYDPQVCYYDSIAKELFQVNEVWMSKDLIESVIQVIAQHHGWSAIKKKNSIICNRVGDDTSTRDYGKGSLKANCTFIVKLSCLDSIPYIPEGSTKKSYKKPASAPHKIIEAVCEHGGSCQPGRLNRVVTLQRGGKYIENMPKQVMFSLCNYLEHSGKLASSLIQRVVRPSWPRAKDISKHDVWNIRLKVLKTLPLFKKTGGDYERFKEIVNSDDLLKGIDNERTLNDDEAYELAQSLWMEIASTVNAGSTEDMIFSFIEYLQLIQTRAPGFVYKLASDNTSSSTTGGGGSTRKKLLGVMWQTATMRRNFELYGGYIGMDMMKRGINTLLWPYCAVAMYDESMKLCIGCEGILCGEREDMYQFVADFLDEFSPGRPLADVNIVAGDGFFDQNFIVRLGFVNATFVLDMWHLLDSGLEQSFGKAGFLKLKAHLVKMVKSQSEYEFENTFRAAKELLESYQPRDQELESKLSHFASQRTSYASYCLAEIPGNRGLHGSACSEQNHSSVLSYLNDGDSKGNNYREHPMTLIKDLLQRQKRYVVRKDEALFGFTQKMRVETDRLKNSPATKENIDLLHASTKLCLQSYERYKKFSLRAEQELVLNTMATDTITNVTCYSVSSIKYPDAPPRIFATADTRCTCKDRCMELDMCAHEIKVRGGFDEALFLPRHMARECVRGSLTTPVPAIARVDAMIGYESESIECSLFSMMNSSSVDEEGMVCAIDGIGDFNLFSGAPGHSSASGTAMYEQPAPGYLPDTNSKVKPMSQKRMNQIFNTIRGCRMVLIGHS